MGDTIAAISTPMTSSSGIGIVRMSGEEAVSIASQIFRSRSGEDLSKMRSHTIHYGFVHEDGKDIDEVLLSLMLAPHTYTREDVVEINCHGGTAVLRRVLQLLRKKGARLAAPGEFTKRAFLNGRIDLTQAEAVMEMIQSKSRLAMESSINQIKGSIKEKVTDLREEIIRDASWIEASVDDPEHIEDAEIPAALQEHIRKWEELIQLLLASSEKGKYIKEGVRTAIAGKPNAGKSSVMNLLLGEERAIVTNIEGTTRDSLTEQIAISGVPLILTDTAGIRQTEDEVEKIGVDRARKIIEEADLVLFVADSSLALDERDREIAKMIENKKTIVLLNKTDLPSLTGQEEISAVTAAPIIQFSAKDGTGLEHLEEYLEKMFLEGDIHYNDQVYITNERHLACLQEAKDSLELVMEGIQMQVPVDMLTIDLMEAYRALGEMIGESVGEDLVDNIFSRFCMGK